MVSRGAATECSPGREPGVFFRHDLSPVGAKECSESFAPTGLRFKTAPTPGLRPGLHSVAAPRLNPGLLIHSGRSTGSPRVLFPAPGPHRTQPVRDRARCATALLRGIGVNYRVLFPVRCVYRDDPKIRSRSRGAARTAV